MYLCKVIGTHLWIMMQVPRDVKSECSGYFFSFQNDQQLADLAATVHVDGLTQTLLGHHQCYILNRRLTLAATDWEYLFITILHVSAKPRLIVSRYRMFPPV